MLTRAEEVWFRQLAYHEGTMVIKKLRSDSTIYRPLLWQRAIGMCIYGGLLARRYTRM